MAARILAGHTLTHAEALALLATPDEDTLDLLNAAFRLRREHFGLSVKVNYLVNLKSGLCPEDCTYCSQRLGSAAQILKYTWLDKDEAVRQAKLGIGGGARRVCMVASGRGPTDRDVDRVSAMIADLKADHPEIEVCACLGILKDGQAERLRAVGVDAYNHNINTAESHYEDICSTHSYADRVATVEKAQAAGMSACSGIIVGMGESDEQLVEAVFALRDMGSDSIPVNFLMPFDGTPLEGTWELSPLRALRILALVRFAAPDRELRMAGGREMHLRSLQPIALQAANSLFLGDYLTSEGQSAEEDLAMIRDNGFHVLGERPGEPGFTGASGEACASAAGESSCCGSGCGSTTTTAAGASATPAPRKRGAGTDLDPNA
nr:biotin synthase BioB [Falsarthrobacter nasiphocae]